MTVAGTVLDISDKALKLERSVKDKKEAMDFTLEKAVEGVKAGDKVTVTYVAKDGKNVVQKVVKAKEAVKKEAGQAVKGKTAGEVKGKAAGQVEGKKK